MTPNRRSTDPQESILANGTAPSCDEVGSDVAGHGSNAPGAITAAESSDTHGFAYIAPELRQPVGVRHVEGGVVAAHAYGEVGEPDWKRVAMENLDLAKEASATAFAHAARLEKAIALLKAVDRDSNARQLACFDEVAAFLDSVGAR